MIKAFFAWLIDLITGRSAAEKAGATQVAAKAAEEGLRDVQRANKAAAAVDNSKGAIDADPNNLDR